MAWWYEREPNRLDELRSALALRYPDLNLTASDGIGLLQGSFPIVHDGVELDRFQIKLRVPPSFPRELPMVFETAGRIPHDMHWHTFVRGALCVSVPEDWLLRAESVSLVAFLDGPLRNFLVSHALAEAGQDRPMGEREHGSAGLLQAYGEMLGVTDARAIPHYLDACAAKKLRRHWPCPCRSGKRLVECHKDQVDALRLRIPRWIAAAARARLTAMVRDEHSRRARMQVAEQGKAQHQAQALPPADTGQGAARMSAALGSSRCSSLV